MATIARILIVEDSPTQAERLKAVLEAGGFNAEVATDAEDAFKHLHAASFDMVISDIVMPGLSGYEFCRSIKANPQLSGIPVILLTSRKDPMDIFEGLECGADSFYTKPYDPELLIERIRHILYNKSLRSQGKLRAGFELEFFGKTFTISSDKEQILDLLISTFEDIVHTNAQLEKSRDELAQTKAKVEEYARRLEGRVRSSEETHRTILESVSEGISSSDEQGILETFNSAAQTIFGYQPDEVIGKNFNVLMPEPYRSQYDADVIDYLRTGDRKVISAGPREAEGLRKDGSVFPLYLNVTEVTVDGRRTFVGVTRDLTSEKETQQKLRHAQRMDAVGQLAGGIAHDFNNLLTVILGSVELLELELSSDSQALVDAIRRAASRGADLTRKLLAFSRRQMLEYKVCDVAALVDGMEGLLRRTLGETIRVETSVPSGRWLSRIDESEFENALLNLAINARDAMPEGGTLTIEIGQQHLDEDYAARHADTTPGDYIVVAVSDTGVGIPEHQLERVFEPFFTAKQEGQGTGLGLSMVYGFIKQSGGHINIYSEEGHGTTVRMYLPISESQQERHRDKPEITTESFAHQAVRVLIVDDDDDVRRLGSALLRQLGCHVIEADDAAQALDLLERHDDIDVLFTDVVMPGEMSGVDLGTVALRRWPNLKILFCSGYAAAAAVTINGLAGGATFISKPYLKADLARKLQQVLRDPA